MKVKITADSTCDLSPQLLEKYKVATLPLTVSLGDTPYKDGVDIRPADIYKYVEETGVLPKTSAINTDDYIRFFQGWRDKGYTVVHINLSSGFSCTHQNALLAAEQVGGVYPIDSQNLSTGMGLLVLQGSIMAAQGKTAQEIATFLEEMTQRVEASFIIDTLVYLHKGGRCSSLTALGANLLKLKPCIEVAQGQMHVGKKYRGSLDRCLDGYISDRLGGREDILYDRIFVTHTGCGKETVKKVCEKIIAMQPQFKEIIETIAGCTITSHCGPNTLGILFVKSTSDISP